MPTEFFDSAFDPSILQVLEYYTFEIYTITSMLLIISVIGSIRFYFIYLIVSTFLNKVVLNEIKT